MVTCAKCNGKSDVKESRAFTADCITETKLRIRQCKTCRWRWKTIEIEYKEAPNASL